LWVIERKTGRLLLARDYLAHTHDPPPGNTVIWRGMSRLSDIELGIMIGDKTCGQLKGNSNTNCYHKFMVKSSKGKQLLNLRTIFLDRDGVVNEKMPEGSYVTSWTEFRILPGVECAISRLNRAGMRVIVVSNQRGIALGLYSTDDVLAIHLELQDSLKVHQAHVDGFYFCPHDEGQCDCRKPCSGMFRQAVVEFPEISAATSIMIGDTKSDVEFGSRLGMFTILIDRDPFPRKPGSEQARDLADLSFPSLSEVVDFLLPVQTAE
jgi:D-glycero-D-manno-heptose 1,7-bisphosphate phosphatase